MERERKFKDSKWDDFIKNTILLFCNYNNKDTISKIYIYNIFSFESRDRTKEKIREKERQGCKQKPAQRWGGRGGWLVDDKTAWVMSNAASDISGREWDGSSPLLRGGGERGPRIGGRRRACYKSTFIQRGEKRGREKRKKVHYWFPVKSRHRSGGGKRKPFSSPFDGGRVASGANMKRGKKAFFFPFLSLSLSSILLVIADNGYLVSVSVEWTMISWRERERENGNRNILLRGKIYSKTIVIPLLVAGGIVTQTRYGWKMILKKKG